jgi:hypothetical protein
MTAFAALALFIYCVGYPFAVVKLARAFNQMHPNGATDVGMGIFYGLFWPIALLGWGIWAVCKYVAKALDLEES